jgi:hypothetical protein
MNPRRTTLTAALSTAAAAAVCAALAGCSTTADANPAPSTTSTGTATAGGTSTTPSSTSTTLDAVAQEKKDRQDAELVWRKLEALAIDMASLTPDQAEQEFQQVAVDPQLTRLRSAYQTLTSRGEAGYGQPIIAVAWREPINGANTATLYDCQDGSQAGYLDKKTGNKLTVGTPDTPMTVSLQRTPQGWRVSSFTIDQVNKCTPGV